MRTTFDQTIIQAIEMAIRNARLAPLFLGGTTSSGGGAGAPPGGYIGTLPQTRVSYDLSEAATLATSFSSSLLDNLNHIRYRIQTLESGNAGVDIYWNNVIVASGVTILNFEGAVTATDNGGGQVTILVSGVTGSGGSTSFLGLTDTPNSYTGHTGKVVVVNGTETGLEFTTVSGASDAQNVKVSVNDTSANFLEQKLVAGTNVSITVLNEGGNEQLEISSSGGAGSDTTAIHDNVSGEISAITEKVSPISADLLIIEDSAASNVKKRVQIGNLPTGGGVPDYICIQDQKAQNTAGGTFTSGAWRTRDLNTKQSDTGGHASVASNQITLNAGTYICEITCPALRVNGHKARLQNITDAVTILDGTSEYADSGVDGEQTHSFIKGKFTLDAQKVLEVQHQCTTTLSPNGFGFATNFAAEIYTIAEFWKVA